MPPIKVISLEKSTERRKLFAERNSHLPFEFVNAVDGMALSKEAIISTGLFAPELRYRLGAYGAALSHLNLWDEAIRTEQTMTIAEDDAVFRHDFVEVHQELLDSMPEWDFVLWGWNLNSILAAQSMPGINIGVSFENPTVIQAPELFQAYTKSPALFRLQRGPGLTAYSLNPAGARKLKSHCFPLAPFKLDWPHLKLVVNHGVDVAASRAYPTMNAFVGIPPLAITRNDQASTTIQNTPFFP